jgi:hypothetical protein
VLADLRFEQFLAVDTEPLEGVRLVPLHEAAVTDHVGGKDGRELSGLGHEVRRENPKRDQARRNTAKDIAL